MTGTFTFIKIGNTEILFKQKTIKCEQTVCPKKNLNPKNVKRRYQKCWWQYENMANRFGQRNIY